MYYRPTDIRGQVQVIGEVGSLDTSSEFAVVTAGGALDGTEVTSASMDTENMYESMVALISYDTKLTSTETLTLAVNVEYSADNSTWETQSSAYYTSAVQATGTTATTTFQDSFFGSQIQKKDYKRYVRFKVTPTLSKTATDTATWKLTLIGGGKKATPTS